MNIEKNQVDALDLQVTFNVSSDDYASSLKKNLSARKRNADIRGFRKGMAPMSLIEKFYGEQALVESVNEVLSDAINGFIKDNKLRVVGEPLPSEDQPEIEWKKGNDFTFKFDIATTPEVSLSISKDDKVPYYKIEITTEAKKEMKENMLRQLGSMEEGEAAGEEDFVIADLEQEGKKVEGAYIAVRNAEGEAHSKFLGAKAGDKFEVNVNEAFTNASDRASLLKVKNEDLDKINPVFNVEIVNVKTFVPASESQETYDKLFGEGKVKNSEEFDAAVEERLKENYTQEADYRLSKDIRDYLVSKAGIELPEAFLKRWLLNANEGKVSAEDIDKEFPDFLSDFRWQMVRGEIMRQNNLKVDDAAMKEGAKAYAAYQYAMYGMGNVPDSMIEDLAGRVLADDRQRNRIEEQVETQMTISAVKGIITLEEKPISVEDFRNLK